MKFRKSEGSAKMSRRCFGEKSNSAKPSTVLRRRFGGGGARSKSRILSEVEDRVVVWELPLLGAERDGVSLLGRELGGRGGREGRGGSGGSTL